MSACTIRSTRSISGTESSFSTLPVSTKGARSGLSGNRYLPHRFIMTFRVESFTVPRLEERLNDLTVQGIFKPDMMIIDGFHVDESMRPALNELKALAGRTESTSGSRSIPTVTSCRARMVFPSRFRRLPIVRSRAGVAD